MRLGLLLVACLAGVGQTHAGNAGMQPAEGIWIAGDLHVHTIWGVDTCISPTERWDYRRNDFDARLPCNESYRWGMTPLEQIQEAEAEGLGFLALTDHNNVMAHRHPEVLGYTGPVTVLGGYENSLHAGHAQMLGARQCYSNAGPVGYTSVECHKLLTSQTAGGIRNLADSLRAAGGAFQINHPRHVTFPWIFERKVVPDLLEVWNFSWSYQSPMIEASDNDSALELLDGFLKLGKRVAISGGSDTHLRAAAAYGVGHPTTWVFATDNSEAAILEGLRFGRTSVSAEPPSVMGPRLHLEADADHDGVFEAMVGDAVTPGSAFRVRAENVPPGALLRLVFDSAFVETVLGDSTYEFTLPVQQFVRAELRVPDGRELLRTTCNPVIQAGESGSGGTAKFGYCRDRLAVLAMTSPIYVR